MTKAKNTTKTSGTVEKFQERYDGAPRRIKDGSIVADLIAFESLGIGKLPKAIAKPLDGYVLAYTDWLPSVKARAATTLTALERAPRQQVEADALAASDVLATGNFGDLAGAVSGIDLVAKATAEHAAAQRLYRAVQTAQDGQLRYLGVLVGSTERKAMIAALEKAWSDFVVVNGTDDITMGEYKRLEHLSIEARAVTGRLLLWVEGQYPGHGFAVAESQKVRKALRDESWAELPTLARIEERDTRAARNAASDEEAAKVQTLAEERAANERYAAENAQNRRGIYAAPRREGDGSGTETVDKGQGSENALESATA